MSQTDSLTEQQIETWVAAYVHAWETYDPGEIAALFTPDGESHEWPYKTDWLGRDAIVEGWNERSDWQSGGWSFSWKILAINGDTAFVEGTGVYKELGSFANLWAITLDDERAACRFLYMWNNER
jgi:ketosteroid isomerase-like protein